MYRTFNRILAGFALATSLSFAQSSTALSGTVYDPSGAVVAGAGVSVANEGTGNVLKQPTNSAGLFSFQSIPVGTYSVTVEMSGFKTVKRTGLTLVVNTPTQENITLELGQSTDVVSVEATAAPINTE